MISKNLSNSNITLVVKNSDVCVGAFCNYILIGAVENSSFVDKCVELPVHRFVWLKSELISMLSYLVEEILLEKEYGGACFETCTWKGQLVNGIKTIHFYKDQTPLFVLNLPAFFYLMQSLYSVLLFTFLFKEIDIHFCETVTQNERHFNQLLASETKLEQFIQDFCQVYSQNNVSATNFASKASLKNIFLYYCEELQIRVWLIEYKNGLHSELLSVNSI